MIIAVASGKGGTGKTTVATNLAMALKDKDIQFLDCDVEEPNAHLFLKPTLEESKEVFLQIPSINHDKCNHCKKCVNFCAFNALADIGEKILVFEEICHGCGGCTLVCPEKTIVEKPKMIGKVQWGDAQGIPFGQGILAIGSPMAPPVIKNTKGLVKDNKLVIIDAPPGTSCPMINTVYGTDYCILVTEPTPFGLNDLKLAVGVLQELKIPHGVIINRAGIGDNKLEEYLENEDIPLLMKIPFHREYAACYAQGHLLVDKFPILKEEFQKVIKKIQRQVVL